MSRRGRCQALSTSGGRAGGCAHRSREGGDRGRDPQLKVRFPYPRTPNPRSVRGPGFRWLTRGLTDGPPYAPGGGRVGEGVAVDENEASGRAGGDASGVGDAED